MVRRIYYLLFIPLVRHRECFLPVTDARNGPIVNAGQLSGITVQVEPYFPDLATQQTVLSALCLPSRNRFWIGTDSGTPEEATSMQRKHTLLLVEDNRVGFNDVPPSKYGSTVKKQ